MSRRLKIYAGTFATLVVASGVLAAVQQRGRLPVPEKPVDPAVRREQLERHRELGLKAAAALTGEFTTRVQYPSVGGPADIDELAALSDLVVVGVPRNNTSRYIQSSDSIVTFYDIDVKSLLGGREKPDQLTLVLLGGRASFQDGSWAQTNLTDFWPLQEGAEHVFFLRLAPAGLLEGNREFVRGHGAYEPTAGPLGVYALSQDRGPFVLPAGNHRSVLGRRIYKSKTSPMAFVDQVVSAIKQVRQR